MGLLPLLSFADSVEIAGAEMTYVFTGGHNYEVTLNIYTRCNQSTMDPVYITVTSQSANFKSYSQPAKLEDMGELASDCHTDHHHITTCDDPASHRQGYRKWRATTTFTLYSNLACEYLFSWQECCRTSLFTTGAAGEPFYIDAYLNICNSAKVSSPQFETDYSPWLAAGQCATKTNYALDPVGSKSTYSYQLVPARKEKNKNVSYTAPYTYRKPLSNKGGFSDQDYFDTSSGCWGLHLDNQTGDLKILPTKDAELSPIAINLIKFTDGKVVSRVTRDLMYEVIQFSENRAPIITGIDCMVDSDLVMEPQESKCFTICSYDPDIDDTVTLSATMEMPDGKFTVEEGKKWPKGQFCWHAELSDWRNDPYKLIVRAQDNHPCDDFFGLPNTSYAEKTILIYVRDLHGHFGIEESGHGFNLTIYPVPATSKIYAEIPEQKLQKVALVDMMGRNIPTPYSFINKKLEVDISSLPEGSYLVQVVTDKNNYSGKVIVTR